MKNLMPRFALLLSASALLASCGESGASSSLAPASSSDIVSSSAVSSSREWVAADYFEAYDEALEYSLAEDDFGVDLTKGQFVIGGEMKTETAILKKEVWNDFSFTTTDPCAAHFAMKNATMGRNKMEMSLLFDQTKLKITGDSLPSAFTNNLQPSVCASAYYEKGTVYLDTSKQAALNYLFEEIVRSASGDEEWKMPVRGYKSISETDYLAFIAALGVIQNAEFGTNVFQTIYDATPSSISYSKVGEKRDTVVTLDMSISSESDLKTVLMGFYDLVSDEDSPKKAMKREASAEESSSDASSSSSSWELPSREDFSSGVDEALEAMVFDHLSLHTVYSPYKGLQGASFDFKISSWDHDKTLAFVEKYLQDGGSASVLPAGETSFSATLGYAYEDAVSVAHLDDDQKERYTTEIVLPEFKKDDDSAE